MNDPIQQFNLERQDRLKSFNQDQYFQELSREWLLQSMQRKYIYNLDWLGRPIIQYPQDMWAVQDIIWRVRPDLIIETGIAHGGSLILSASILALLDMCDAIQNGEMLNPKVSQRKVLGIDIDIREHNRTAIEAHPLASRIQMIQGSSVSEEITQQVQEIAKGYQRVLVFLDSMHTHDHVLQELNAYAPLVTPGSYCVVFDTFVEDMPPQFFSDRPWDVGNNPKTAVHQWLEKNSQFCIDKEYPTKLMVTAVPDGFLYRKE